MTRRERIITTTVVGLLGLLLARQVFVTVQRQFTHRHDQAEAVRFDIEKEEIALERARAAERILGEMKDRALPGGGAVNTSSSEYSRWLVEVIQQAGLANATVRPVGRFTDRRSGDCRLSYSITADGKLESVVGWWESFYATGRLHQISKASIKPVTQGSRILKLTATVEVYAMSDAPAGMADAVPPPPRAVTPDMAERIVLRNPFGPPNTPPQLELPAEQVVHLGQELDLQAKGTDPDEGDVVKYVLRDEPEGATIDGATGQLRWKPSELGEFSITVVTHDDGIPKHEAIHQLTVRVTEPPQDKNATPSDVAFDDAEQTYFCGMTSVEDRPRIWLDVRSKGEFLFLGEGDSLRVGSVSGTVGKIDERTVEFQLGDRTISLRLGDSLASLVATDS